MNAPIYLAVAFGSMLGGVLRWAASDIVQSTFAGSWPWGTLFVNVTGSFLIGLYAALAAAQPGWQIMRHQNQFVMAGICGGYTTFSIFSLEALALLQARAIATASLVVLASVGLWLFAVLLGHALGRRVFGPPHG